jgi:hypothetical protein
MGKGFDMVETRFRGHPPGEHPFHRSPFFIRVIREIRGSRATCKSQAVLPNEDPVYDCIACGSIH